MNYLSATHNSGKTKTWEQVTVLRDNLEQSMYDFVTALIDDKHVLEQRILILERQIRELKGGREQGLESFEERQDSRGRSV